MVDDNPAGLIVLEAVLGNDYNLVRANSGDEAIATVQRRRDIDVVLLDVQMPDMDGFETARRIKALPNGEDLPIIFVTAIFSEDPYVKRGYAVGGVDYFSKPFDPELLRLKVGIYASFRMKAELLRERERRMREAAELVKVGRDLSLVLEQLPAGVFIADFAGRICQTTDEAGRVLKAPPGGPRETYLQLVEWWKSEGGVLTGPGGPVERAIATGEATHSQRLLVRCMDGSTKDIVASVLPLRAVEGDVMGVVVLVRDVSVAKGIEAELEERATRLVNESVEAEDAALH